MLAIPKKIKAVLDELGITNVVNGYITRTPAKGVYRAVFTGWDTKGQVVCVLIKNRKQPWKLAPR